MLTLDQLSKTFGGERAVEAVSQVSLQIEQGQFVAIVGRSGSGKSTLLGMLGGISRPSSGVVKVAGVDQWSLDNRDLADLRNRKIGFVFQFASLLPTLRAIDNVALPGLISGALSESEAYARARGLLEQVGLAERAQFYPGQLSGGEQRRVAIARALINSPDILLADEPTADLDEETESDILNLLIGIHKSYGLTLVVVTHNPDIAARADTVVRMQGGRAVSVDTSQTAAGAGDEVERTASPEAAAKIRRIFENSPDGTTGERVSLGAGIERLIGRFILLAIPIFAVVWSVHWGVAAYQQSLVDSKAAEQRALEDLANAGISADVKDLTMDEGNKYTLTVLLRNTTSDDKPVYVMGPTVRGFVQVGTSWQEVPLKPLDAGAQKVQKITGEKLFRYTLEPDVKNFEQLLPYYMHVRFTNEMLISPSAQPKSDLIERNDSYYVYLKPHDADDAAIETKMKFPGAPPVWIPMPPH
ncbi:MAG: ABC transporter ATP-binding protein [Candidatus Obscuribacterales bacterium]|jgi:putative ABC transport system ATP-binding protein/macrolide transport system ATP-binding/permease protein/lipoprotein-releasing system ATP-binding protein